MLGVNALDNPVTAAGGRDDHFAYLPELGPPLRAGGDEGMLEKGPRESDRV